MVWQRDYDTSGRLVSNTDPNGKLTTITHDNRNRLALVTYPDGLGTLSLVYDAGNRLAERIYSDGTKVLFGYTANGYLASASNGVATTLVNTFDANNRKIGNNGITADYDAGGRFNRFYFDSW